MGNRRRHRRLAVVTALLASVALVGCGSSGGKSDKTTKQNMKSGLWGAVLPGDGKPVRGGTLTINQVAAPQGISPLVNNEEPSNLQIQVIMAVFDQLVTMDVGSIDVSPGLAESWTISDDGLTYEFKLRDAKFSDGSPVTSSDVVYTIERASKSSFSDMFTAVKGMETPDDHTFILKLSKPTPAMLYYLASATAAVLPERIVKRMGDDAYNKKPIGSGPFAVRSWTPAQEIELVRNEHHWREGKPYLDAIRITSVDDDNTRVLNLLSGNVDVIDSPPFSQIKPINASDKAEVLIAPGSDMFGIFFNNARKPFDESAVRRALNLATPVDQIIDAVFSGAAPVMNTVTPKLKYWTDQAKRYPYDLDKAKAELAKSSVPNGFKTSINITSADQASSQVAQIVKDSYAKIGVNVTINNLDAASRSENYRDGNWNMNVTPPGLYTSDTPIDDQFALLLYMDTPINHLRTSYKNPDAAKIAAEAIEENDEGKRKELFTKLQIMGMEDPPIAPIAYTPNRAGVAKGVHGFNYLVCAWWRLENVWKQGAA
jgi:peptide/nickel transport system substrate-binding protein